MNKPLNTSSPESVELLNYIEGTGNLSKHLREVFEYASIATASGTEALPVETCGSLSFLSELAKLIEKIELLPINK